jgi:hypothetical protein
MSELGAGGTWCARRGILSQSLIGSCYKSSINQTAPLPTEVELDASAYDVWHDRAVFHFLTAESDRVALLLVTAAAL